MITKDDLLSFETDDFKLHRLWDGYFIFTYRKQWKRHDISFSYHVDESSNLIFIWYNDTSRNSPIHEKCVSITSLLQATFSEDKCYRLRITVGDLHFQVRDTGKKEVESLLREQKLLLRNGVLLPAVASILALSLIHFYPLPGKLVYTLLYALYTLRILFVSLRYATTGDLKYVEDAKLSILQSGASFGVHTLAFVVYKICHSLYGI